MTGSLDESHIGVVKEQYESDQSRLSNFAEHESSPTTIAVVSKPGALTEYCDEHLPTLGMPENHLKRYHQYKAGFKTNSAVENPAKRAYKEAELERHYAEHLRTSEAAQIAVSRLVSRLNEGEDLTLVCFEEPSKPCHRHQLKQVIESRLSSNFAFSLEKGRPA